MRYPVMTTADASVYLASRRAGSLLDLDRLIKTRGEGAELDQSFVADLVADLASIKSKHKEGLKSQKNANAFESDAARAIHERVAVPCEVLADADFWLWLAVVHFGDVVEWRYGNPEGGTSLSNYGVGARTENLIYRLWLGKYVLDKPMSSAPNGFIPKASHGRIDLQPAALPRR